MPRYYRGYSRSYYQPRPASYPRRWAAARPSTSTGRATWNSRSVVVSRQSRPQYRQLMYHGLRELESRTGSIAQRAGSLVNPRRTATIFNGDGTLQRRSPGPISEGRLQRSAPEQLNWTLPTPKNMEQPGSATTVASTSTEPCSKCPQCQQPVDPSHANV